MDDADTHHEKTRELPEERDNARNNALGSSMLQLICIHRVTVRNFVTYLCQLVFAAILWIKLLEMFVTLLSLKYGLSVD